MAYGGPADGTSSALANWLAECIDFQEAVGDLDYEQVQAFLRGQSDEYLKFLAAVEACDGQMPWRHPDSGAELGSISLIASMCSDGTLEADTPVALTCFQWSCDLLDFGIKVKVVGCP